MQNLELKILIFDIDILKNEISAKEQKIEYIKKLAFTKIEENYIPEIKDENNKNENNQNNKENKENKKDNNDKDKKINDEIEKNINENNNTSLFIKKLFRKIVIKTHPDKIKDDELNKIYINAVQYYKDNNEVELVLIGNKLNIEMNDIDNNLFKKFDEYKTKLKKKSLTLEYNDFYVWYTTDNPKLKEIMFNKLKKRTLF
jgi:hypothetical protein